MTVETESTGWVVPESLRSLAQDGDQEVVEEFLLLFRTDTTSRLRQLTAALSAGDLVHLRAQAHAIKGSAIQVGANQVAEICRWLELESAGKTLAEIQEMLTRLTVAFERVCGQMELYAGCVGMVNGKTPSESYYAE